MEANNIAAMREALEQLMAFTCNSCQERYCDEDVEEEGGVRIPSPCNAIIVARTALAAPARNCDVGTPEEQRKRFNEFCEKGQHTDKGCCGGCPIVTEGWREKVGVSCELAWAQMPYEGGVK